MFMVGAPSEALCINHEFIISGSSSFAVGICIGWNGGHVRCGIATTFTFIIFAFEIVRDYNAILPLMLGCVIADTVGLLLMKIPSRRKSLHGAACAFTASMKRIFFSRQRSQKSWTKSLKQYPRQCCSPSWQIALRKGPSVTKHKAVFIQNENDELVGIITQGDVLRSDELHSEYPATVSEAGNTRLNLTYPDETLHEALSKMLQNNIGRLPVVERTIPTKLIGYLGRTEVLEARMHRIKEEKVVEQGWIRYVKELVTTESDGRRWQVDLWCFVEWFYNASIHPFCQMSKQSKY